MKTRPNKSHLNLKKLILTLGVVMTGLGWSPQASAYHLTLVGVYEIGGATLSSGSASTMPGSIGYGGLVEFKIFRKVGMEFGGLYMTRGFVENSNQVQFTSVELPVLLRLYPASALSIGLGGYFSRGMGSVVTGSSSESYLPTTGGTYSANDAGFMASIALSIKIFPGTRLWLDARYCYGLTNITPNSGVSTYLNDIQFLGGLRFGK